MIFGLVTRNLHLGRFWEGMEVPIGRLKKIRMEGSINILKINIKKFKGKKYSK